MAKFGHHFLSGLLWIVILFALGWGGMWIASQGGIWVFLGWIVGLLAFSFCGMSIWHLARTTYMQWKGLKMRAEDPEEYEEMKERYESATDRLEKGS
jgi:hypothetical protein